MLCGRARFVGGEEGRADLYSLRTQCERGDDPAGVGDAARCDHGRPYLLDGDPDERQCSEQGVLRGSEEGSAMTARFGTRRDDDVDARLVECYGFVRGRGGPEGDDSAVPEGGENALVGDAEGEAESRRPYVEDRRGLVLEPRGEALGLWRCSDTHLFVERRKSPDRRVEALAGHLGFGQVVIRDPEVQRE